MAKGEITHVEFPADDPARAQRFWSAVAGWELGEREEFPDYWMFRASESSGGAIARRGNRGVSDHVRVYVTVDSLEDACAAAEANGGRVIEPPEDIGGGMGRSAAIIDSEGNDVGLWEAPADEGGGPA